MHVGACRIACCRYSKLEVSFRKAEDGNIFVASREAEKVMV